MRPCGRKVKSSFLVDFHVTLRVALLDMHIIVIGAGVIGVTTAWYLREAGHTVTVLDANSAPALGTSYANAGQLSYSYAMPWAAPGVPLKAMKWLLDADAPFKVHPDWKDPGRQVAWMHRMFQQCTEPAFIRNKTAMLHLAAYSRQSLVSLLSNSKLKGLADQFDLQSKGTLQVFRRRDQLDLAAREAHLLEQAGVRAHLMTMPDAIFAREPALANAKEPVIAAIHLPGDATGDCFQFTQALAQKAQSHGVKFQHMAQATAIRSAPDGGVGVEVDTVLMRDEHVSLGGSSRLEADAVVICTGSDADELLAPIGASVRETLYPVKGYSLTYELANPARGPVSTVMDETSKVAITRLGNRMRVGGTAELSGFNRDLREARRKTLTDAVERLFPGAGPSHEAEFWTGMRPSTPTSVPNIGLVAHANVRNVWANFGHGTLGWTMACGSAQALAKMMSGLENEVPDVVLAALAQSPMLGK